MIDWRERRGPYPDRRNWRGRKGSVDFAIVEHPDGRFSAAWSDMDEEITRTKAIENKGENSAFNPFARLDDARTACLLLLEGK